MERSNELVVLNRRYIRTDSEIIDGKQISKFVFGETEELTWGMMWSNAMNFGKGLRQMGLQPFAPGDDLEDNIQSKHPKPSTILLYEDTGIEWTTAFHGSFSQSIVVATSYSTLGISSVVEAINEGKISTILCNWSSLSELLEQCAEQCAAHDV